MNDNASNPLWRSFSNSQDVRLPCCIPAKGEKAPTFPIKLVVCPEVEGGDLCQVGGDLFQVGDDLCQVDGVELATARFPNATASTQLY